MRSFATKAFLVVLVGASTVAATAVAATAEERRHVRLKSRDAKDERPFDDAVRVGNMLYLAGRIGLDPATGKPPAEAAAEVRTVMDQIKAVLAQEGMTMDDLVTVTVYCTDLSLYGTFNDVYRTYFTKGFPARAFIGSGPLLAGGRFEVQGIAVKQ
jgi:2-iminobutanoate/2-iminopropanoate deaminase